MTLWILAVVLLVSLGIIGYYQGGIRVGFSLVGLIVAAALAQPLSFISKAILPIVGLKHPAVLTFVAPALMFLLILILFKCAALAVHRKVDAYYKYQDSDTRRLLFERLNQRLGICLGVANATVYVFLISVAASVLGYLTVQFASSEKDPLLVRWCNRLAEDVQRTRMDHAVAPFNPATEWYFDAVDILGNVFHTPLLQSRLSSYPVFLTLAERKEFQDLGNDIKFQEFWQSGPTVTELIHHEKVRPLIEDIDLYTNVVAMLGGDLKDLKGYIEAGKSEKYDEERILGRWDFDYAASVNLAKQKTPNMGSVQLRALKAGLSRLNKAKFTATIDNTATLKIPAANSSVSGTWKNSDGKYLLRFNEGSKKSEAEAQVDARNRLVFSKDGFALVFEK